MDKHKKPLKYNNCYTAILVVGLFILTACQNQRTSSPAISQAVEFNATRTLSETALPRATSTSTGAPTLTNAPVTLLPTLTRTPLPTLDTDDAQMRVLRLLEDNADCQFPCWWGILPGKTLWENALILLTDVTQL